MARSRSAARDLTAHAQRTYAAVRELLGHAADRDPKVVCAWGVTIGECHAIEEIARAESCSLGEIAARLRLDKSTASRTISSLVRKGLVARESRPSDRRSVALTLTAKGEKIAESVARANLGSYADLLRDIPAAERESLVASLQRIAELIGSLEPKRPR